MEYLRFILLSLQHRNGITKKQLSKILNTKMFIDTYIAHREDPELHNIPEIIIECNQSLKNIKKFLDIYSNL